MRSLILFILITAILILAISRANPNIGATRGVFRFYRSAAEARTESLLETQIMFLAGGEDYAYFYGK